MAYSIVQVDAFTAQPFAGNPAAVCVLERAAEERWMQAVAREMNLSETAFLHPEDGGYRLRWFTPAVEVALCGHATLASAHVLWEDGRLPPERMARFQTQSGELTAARRDDWIEMDFPAKQVEPATAPPELLEALGLAAAVFVGKNVFDYLVEVESEETLRRLVPDHSRLRRLPVRGVIVTARAAEPRFDFVSRFFAPGAGVDEDPVTGSAHTALAPYWAAKLGRDELTGYQASARGGIVRVAARGARVMLAGQAVTVMRAQLIV